MNAHPNDVETDKWKQILVEFESNVLPMHGNNIFRGRVPVSGILYNNTSRLVSQSSSGIIVSALPWQSSEASRWKASGISNNICSFYGPSLSSLKLKVSSCEQIPIHPFVDVVNQVVLQASFAPKPISAVNTSNDDIAAEEFSITGICYELQKNAGPSAKSFESCKWKQYRLQPCYSRDAFTSFFVKIEKGVHSSFWGAPIFTADGKVKSIVVYQQNFDDETVAIVGMQINSFIDTIPLLSNQLASIL